jgi:hypothetical protein
VGLLSALVKAGVAKKVYSEARKPQNQAKAKQLFSTLTGKGGSTSGPRGGTRS